MEADNFHKILTKFEQNFYFVFNLLTLSSHFLDAKLFLLSAMVTSIFVSLIYTSCNLEFLFPFIDV